MREFARRAVRYAARRLVRRGEAGRVPVATSVAETTPMSPRESAFSARRLNLIVPSINARHYFGGIHTAVQVFEEMAKHFPARRIILTDAGPDGEALERFSRYDLVDADADPEAFSQVVPFADRYGKTLPVSRHDAWLVTAWWTAYAAQRLGDWQRRTYDTPGRLAYVIQDFEPGFYPWSSQSAMALATYRPTVDVGIFNTSLLADYFTFQGIGYTDKVIFEPTINDGLRAALESVRRESPPRQKRIVVYARPSTPRNAFTLVCEALRAWGWSDPTASEWEIVALGELTEDIDLGPVRLKAMGKLDIQAYAALLSTSAIGLSLMVSPHPSYPPLEMAAFGMGVVTNAFANKDLSSFASGVRSVGVISPENLAAALRLECARWSDNSMEAYPVMEAGHPFLAMGGFEAIAVAAIEAMRRGE